MLIFFFNHAVLPFGLELHLLLAPFFLFYVHQGGYSRKFIIPAVVISLYALIHSIIGVEEGAFIISSVIQLSLLVSVVAFLYYYENEPSMPHVFKRLAVINTLLTLVAVATVFSESLKPIFWYLVPFTYGEEPIPRLKLFNLEASHYSFALIPLFFFFFFQAVREFRIGTVNFFLLASLCASLILSFSLGVLAVIVMSLSIVTIVYFRSFLSFSNTRKSFFVLAALVGVSMLFLLLFYPENPLFSRVNNLFIGQDTSGRGRPYEAFDVARMVLDVNNSVFGIGLGQFKILGRSAWIYYYQIIDVPEVVRLPNCMAETMVTYGYFGEFLKLGLQIFLFIKLKVYSNVFRLSVFIAVFIYQFTGSYLSNLMEYVVWIIALVPKFTMFDKISYFKR